jgi:hypothetical protein
MTYLIDSGTDSRQICLARISFLVPEVLFRILLQYVRSYNCMKLTFYTTVNILF